MIRVILKRKSKDSANGLTSETFETIDVEIPLLESRLKRGGFNEEGYDFTELCGVEILK